MPNITNGILGLYVNCMFSNLDISMYKNIRYVKIDKFEEFPHFITDKYKFSTGIRVIETSFKFTRMGNLTGREIKTIENLGDKKIVRKCNMMGGCRPMRMSDISDSRHAYHISSGLDQ